MPNTQQLNNSAESIALDHDKLPNIDVSALFENDANARRTVIDEIRQACLSTGFFYIHNTPVKKKVIDNALQASKDFFSLPDSSDSKQQVHNRNAGEMKGWGPMFGEPAYQSNTVAHVESFDIGQQLSEDEYRQLNIQANIWPELKEFRSAVLEYYQGVTYLARGIAEVFSELLQMPGDFINDNSGPTAPRTMRLLHYPENNVAADEVNVGISAHTDFECFTIMNQTAGGLELCDINGRWCQAPSDIGSFTIIVGDMLERLSNGCFQATGHRVVNTPWTRHSLVLFFALDGDYSVKPLPHFIEPGSTSNYPAITQDDHIAEQLELAAGKPQDS